MSGTFLIWSIEHDAWWAPHRQGYTRELQEAGHYAEQEAREIVSKANLVAFHECAIPVACVEGAEPLNSPLDDNHCQTCGARIG